MSSELPSCTNNRLNATSSILRNPKKSIEHALPLPPPSDVTGITKQREKTVSALEAALVVKSKYTATLQADLYTFLDIPTERCLTLYSAYFHKEVKLQENVINNDYVPSSVKKIGLTLQALDEVKKTEDFKALHTQLEVELDKTRRTWTSKYALPVEKMNCNALKRRFQESFCSLLASAARGFIALAGTSNYTEHEAILDLLAISPQLVLREPIAKTPNEFLLLYKQSNNIAYIPSPTVEHSLKDVLTGINGTTRARRQPNTTKMIVIDVDDATAEATPIAGLHPSSPIETTAGTNSIAGYQPSPKNLTAGTNPIAGPNSSPLPVNHDINPMTHL